MFYERFQDCSLKFVKLYAHLEALRVHSSDAGAARRLLGTV